ncbi:MAG: hypothetical protein WC935_00175 [Thermoleophilia bacterium]
MIIHKYKTQPVEAETPFQLASNQQILLMPVGDIHYLSQDWPQNKVLDHFKWGMDRGAYFLGVGEPIDLASASQRAIMSPLRDSVKKELNGLMTDVVERFVRLLDFTRGRWIGFMEGDHYWMFENGTTTDQMICTYMGCKFLGDASLIRLTYPEAPRAHPEADCIIYAHHGFGSSRLSGGQLHRVEDLLKFIDADIYLMGHSHAKVSAPIDRQAVTPDGVHHHRTKVLARTGAFMKSYLSSAPLGLDEPAVRSRASYAEKAAYMPAAMGGLCFGIGYEKIPGSAYYRPTIHYSV